MNNSNIIKIPDWNVKKFEEKLEKEVKHRKDCYSPGKLAKCSPSSGIFEQFLLIGIPPNTSADQDPDPKVLVAFPPFELPNLPLDRVIKNSMPTGANRDFLSRSNSSPIQDEFVFQFGGNDDPIYGVCVHVNTTNTNDRPFYGSKITKKRNFCFCLTTKVPAFAAHFSFLTYLSLLTVGQMKNVHSYSEFISVEFPTSVLGLQPIAGLDLVHQIGHHPSINMIPEVIENELASYYTSNFESDPVVYAKDFVLKFPQKNDVFQKAIGWASLDTLFSILSLMDILTILCGLLLDRQVLVIGSRLQEVSMTVYALQTLLQPFKFAGTVIPVLPTHEDFIDILQLPTPFLIGIPICPKLRKMSFLDTAVFVDLNKKTVPSIDRNMPKFPGSGMVMSELAKLLSRQKHMEEGHPFGFPSVYAKYIDHKYTFTTKTCEEIIEIVQKPFYQLLFTEYVCCFFVTDLQASPEGVTVFNEELFLAQVENNSERAFWEALLESQTFQMFIEDKMGDFINEKIENDEAGRSGRRPSIGSKTHRTRRLGSRTKSLTFMSVNLPIEQKILTLPSSSSPLKSDTALKTRISNTSLVPISQLQNQQNDQQQNDQQQNDQQQNDQQQNDQQNDQKSLCKAMINPPVPQQ